MQAPIKAFMSGDPVWITSDAVSSASRHSTATRRSVKLTRASTIPGVCLRPFSILRFCLAISLPSIFASVAASTLSSRLPRWRWIAAR